MSGWITEHVVVDGAEISWKNWEEIARLLGVTAVVSLRAEYQNVFTDPLPAAYLWLPVQDHTSPTLDQLVCGAQFIDTAVRTGHKVLVHCRMGISRSPTLAAAYLVWTGCSVDEAVRRVEDASTMIFSRPRVSHESLDKMAAKLRERGLARRLDTWRP